MKKFLTNTVLFFSIILVIIIIIILSPTTYSASQSLLFTSIKKDSLLENTPQPRIIFIGGSNVAYGLSSQMIKDSLDVNVVNASIHAGLGLKYMMTATEPYLKSGDILVIIPEYEQFYGSAANGGSELLRMVFDVSLKNINKLDWQQIEQSHLFIPEYIKSKLKIKNYYKPSIAEDYRYTAFNEYGDAYVHWNKDHKSYASYQQDSTATFNTEIFDDLITYIHKLQKQGVTVYISFPGLEENSYLGNLNSINNLHFHIDNSENIEILGAPSDFVYPTEITYDTPYHLRYDGVVKRTNSLIHFLKEKLEQDKDRNEI